MKKVMKHQVLLGIALALMMGCGDDAPGASNDGNGDTDQTGDTGGNNTGDGDTNGDGNSDGDGDGNPSGDTSGVFVACETLTTDLTPITTRVMLLEDKSGSMKDNDKWELATSAINTMVTDFNDAIDFGLDLFANESSSDWSNDSGCSVGDNVVLDVAPNNADSIISELAGRSPDGGTPLLLAMQNYTDTAFSPVFLDGTGNSYLIIISDGGDTCGLDGEYDEDNGATPAELGAVSAELLADYGVYSIVIGFGQGAEPDELNAIAEAGGTEFSEYLQADNGDDLNSALNKIAESVVVNCEFEVGTFENPEVNFDWVVVTFDGEQVGRDNGCAADKGWTWTDDTHTAIQFCKEACATLEAEEVTEVKVELACDGDDVVVIVPE